MPWPSAQEVVGPLATRAPFATARPSRKKVHEWLADINETTLGVFEYEGLMHSLPDNLMHDPRTNSTCVLCLLDVPQSSDRWSSNDRQEHQFSMMWHVSKVAGRLETGIDFNIHDVDQDGHGE